MVFGCNFILFVLCYRMYRLYFLIVLAGAGNGGARGFEFWWPLLASYSPVVILALVSVAMPGVMLTLQPMIDPYSTDAYLYSLYVVCIGQIVFLLVLAYRVSKIRASFNEFRENLATAVLSVVFLVVSFGFVMTGFNYTTFGKAFLCVLCISWSFLIYAGPIMRPVIGFYFNREAYAVQFKQGLKAENLPTGLGAETSSGSKSIASGLTMTAPAKAVSHA
ncbi:hypothetical protein HDU91_004625 [Kappamyces sp. JEL0680]|nr:hypothetical protein HDU91_004625 [Kappamyces sp. JEL0680]